MATNAEISLGEFKGNNLDVTMFGAKGDCLVVNDGAMDVGGFTVKCDTSTPFKANFTDADGNTVTEVGKQIWITGAGASGGILKTVITAFVSMAHVTVAAAASATVSGKRVQWGTQNSLAFTAVSAYNAASGRLLAFRFPAGRYWYDGGLHFVKEVWLWSECSATLDYSGSGKAIKFGPDGLTISDYEAHKVYGVQGLTFTGGLAMTHGLYFNIFLTQPRVIACNFYDFGNINAWGIWCVNQNWHVLIANCHWYTTSASVGRNWINVNGGIAIGTEGPPDTRFGDNGNSRLTMYGCLGSQQDPGGGVGVYFTGTHSMIYGNKLEAFGTANIRLGGIAPGLYSKIIHNYFETVNGGDCIQFSDISGPYIGFYTSRLTIRDNYCNLHNLDFSTISHFLAPGSASGGMQFCVIDENHVTESNTPLVALNDIPSQVGNLARHNTVNGEFLDNL